MSAAVVPAVDRHLVGPPAGTLTNPTFLVFCAATATAAASSWAHCAGRFGLPGTVLVNAACLYGLYTVSHEAAHRLAHGDRRINDWMGRIASALEGTSYQSYRLLHLQHHAHTNDVERDPDRVLGRRPSWALPLWLVLRVWNEYTWASRHHLWRGRAALREHRVTVGLQLAAVAVAAGTGRLEVLLVVWILPFVVAGLLVYLLVAWLVHSPHCSPDPLENTRNVGGAWGRVLTLNQSLHHVHHLWMTVPWFRYPRARGLAGRAAAARERGDEP